MTEEEMPNSDVAGSLLAVWLHDPNAYDIRTAISLYPTLAQAALQRLETSGSIMMLDPNHLRELVSALALDSRPTTARKLLELIDADILPATTLSGRAFEQINWTLGGRPDSA